MSVAPAVGGGTPVAPAVGGGTPVAPAVGGGRTPPDFLEKRVFAMQRVFLPGADIHISVCFRAILGWPTGAIIPSGDFGDMIAKHHDVAFVQFGVFCTVGVVMFDGMKMRWRDLLVCVPRTDVMGSVFRSDGGSGDIGHNVMKIVEMVEYLIKHFNFSLKNRS